MVLADGEEMVASSGLLCYPEQHPSGSSPQPWLSEQGKCLVRIFTELIARVQQQLLSAPPLCSSCLLLGLPSAEQVW